jgi:hypothetical protein
MYACNVVVDKYLSKRTRQDALGLCAQHLLIIVALAAVPPLTSYAEPAGRGSEPKGFDLASDPDFRNYRQVVTVFARKHRPGAANDFCIEGYTTSDNLKSAWVIWRQGEQIILWEGQKDGLDASRAKIDLRSDVVPTDVDLHGSTYLVTKAWVEKITSTCDRFGVKVHVPER